MNISKNGIEFIKSFEGVRLNAYQDSAGVWTIGYGHTGGVSKGQRITMAQANEYLKADIKKFEGYVNNRSYVPFEPNQNQFDALVSFAFNLGQESLKTLCKGRNILQIANAMTLYNKASGIVLSGLVKRRTAERQLFLTDTIKIKSPAEAISLLVRKGIIVEPDKWYDGKWSDEDFKFLIVKVAQFIAENIE